MAAPSQCCSPLVRLSGAAKDDPPAARVTASWPQALSVPGLPKWRKVSSRSPAAASCSSGFSPKTGAPSSSRNGVACTDVLVSRSRSRAVHTCAMFPALWLAPSASAGATVKAISTCSACPAGTVIAGALDCAGSVDVSNMNQRPACAREWATATRLTPASSYVHASAISDVAPKDVRARTGCRFAAEVRVASVTGLTPVVVSTPVSNSSGPQVAPSQFCTAMTVPPTADRLPSTWRTHATVAPFASPARVGLPSGKASAVRRMGSPHADPSKKAT